MSAYDDARNIAMAADQNPFVLPSYSGGSTDYAYLKEWVVNQVETIYDVSANVFNQATVYSTTILRDFVHRALYQESGRDSIDTITANDELLYSQNSDVATAFRYPAYGLCGLVAWQEYQVFQAFGYKTTDVAIYNNTVDQQTDGHVTTEVYLSDLKQYIVQDATYNFAITNSDGDFLSFDQARYELYAGDGITLDGFNNYVYYPSTGTYSVGVTASDTSNFETQYFKVPYWEYTTNGSLSALTANLFPSSSTAHNSSSNQGGTYTTEADAINAVFALKAAGNDWLPIANAIRASGHYVSGFALANDTQDVISHWLTVRASDGSYVSIDVDHNVVLHGSYDQLASEATGGTDLNPSVDLTNFLRPAYLIDYNGTTENGFVPDPGANVHEFGDLVLRNINTGATMLWDMPDFGSLNNGITIVHASDVGFSPVGYGDYVGDYQHDVLFQKANGEVGFWDGAANWTRLGNMSPGWSIVSSDDHSDFTADGADDILWHNDTTGAVGFWDLLNGANTGYHALGGAAVSQWSVAATADLNGDGTDDILWQNTSIAEVREWLVSSGVITQNIGFIGPADSKIIGTADIAHDGSADIIWENPSTGAVGYWNMLNGQNTGYHALGTVPTNSTVAAIRDMTADGTPDIVWQDTTGHLTLWNLDHAANTTPTVVAQYLGAHASDWVVA